MKPVLFDRFDLTGINGIIMLIVTNFVLEVLKGGVVAAIFGIFENCLLFFGLLVGLIFRFLIMEIFSQKTGSIIIWLTLIVNVFLTLYSTFKIAPHLKIPTTNTTTATTNTDGTTTTKTDDGTTTDASVHSSFVNKMKDYFEGTDTSPGILKKIESYFKSTPVTTPVVKSTDTTTNTNKEGFFSF